MGRPDLERPVDWMDTLMSPLGLLICLRSGYRLLQLMLLRASHPVRGSHGYNEKTNKKEKKEAKVENRNPQVSVRPAISHAHHSDQPEPCASSGVLGVCQ